MIVFVVASLLFGFFVSLCWGLTGLTLLNLLMPSIGLTLTYLRLLRCLIGLALFNLFLPSIGLTLIYLGLFRCLVGLALVHLLMPLCLGLTLVHFWRCLPLLHPYRSYSCPLFLWSLFMCLTHIVLFLICFPLFPPMLFSLVVPFLPSCFPFFLDSLGFFG